MIEILIIVKIWTWLFIHYQQKKQGLSTTYLQVKLRFSIPIR